MRKLVEVANIEDLQINDAEIIFFYICVAVKSAVIDSRIRKIKQSTNIIIYKHRICYKGNRLVYIENIRSIGKQSVVYINSSATKENSTILKEAV